MPDIRTFYNILVAEVEEPNIYILTSIVVDDKVVRVIAIGRFYEYTDRWAK